VVFVKKDQVNGHETDVIQIRSKQGQQVDLYLDSSGQVLKKQYPGQAITGSAPQVEELLEDFREVSGIRVPFKVTVFQGGKKFSEMQVTGCRYNTGLKPEELAKP
jgi:hypothetical protein